MGGASCAEDADFRHGDLEVRQNLQQESLEGFVGAVQFVDQQHRRTAAPRLQRLEQGALDQELFGKHVPGECRPSGPAAGIAGRFGQPDLDHLPGIVPLVDGARNIEPFVTLQPDQVAAEAPCQHLGDLRLADAGLPFEEQRPAELQRQVEGRRQRPVGDIGAGGEQSLGRIDGIGQGSYF